MSAKTCSQALFQWYLKAKQLVPKLKTSLVGFHETLIKFKDDENKSKTEGEYIGYYEVLNEFKIKNVELITQYKELIKLIDEFTIDFKDLKKAYQNGNNNASDSLFQLIDKNEKNRVKVMLLPILKPLKTPLYDFRKLYSDFHQLRKESTWFTEAKLHVITSGTTNQHAEMKVLEELIGKRKIKNLCCKVGVSKLACAACQEVINYFNSINHNIKIRGFHGKIYDNWDLPNIVDDNVCKLLISKLALKLETGQFTLQHMQSELADTDTSGVSRSVSLNSLISNMDVRVRDDNVNVDKITSWNRGNQQQIKQSVSDMLHKIVKLAKEYPGYSIVDLNLNISIQQRSFQLHEILRDDTLNNTFFDRIENWVRDVSLPNIN